LTPRLALDRSLRSRDANGNLHVESSNISKANVCPYYGREIPNSTVLGLDPNKIYRLFRDPAELAKGASTFNNLPILIRHVAISAEAPRKDLIVGTTGSDVTFEAPYLKCSLAVWTAEAIALIEAEAQRELSSAYRYDAVMEPGAYGAQPYDGRMVNIRGNHVALVSEGRAGSDVFVADENPPELSRMKHAARIAALKPYLAPDADLIALDAEMDKEDEKEKEAAEDRAHDCYGNAQDAWDKMSAKDKKSARDEWKKAEDKKAKDAKAAADKAAADKKASDKKAKDADPDHRDDFAGSKDSITADQLDAAIKAAVEPAVVAAADLARKQVNDLHAAREAVKPIVGIVAMDSAEEVYAFALKHAGVKIDGVHPSAFPALLDVVKSRKPVAPVIALDAAVNGHTVRSIWPTTRPHA
jgi:hypothetical protein